MEYYFDWNNKVIDMHVQLKIQKIKNEKININKLCNKLIWV